MRALVLREFTGPDGLILEDIPPPSGDGARIEVHAAGVSFADVLITRGLYQLKPPLPFVPGLEVAGVLRDAPAGFPLPVGSPVAAFAFGGAFAEEAVIDPAAVVAVPDGLGFDEAAGLVVNYQTAWLALVRRARLQPGERVLVQGAGGGLGSAVVSVAKALDAFVVAVASTPEKQALAAAAGADAVVGAGEGWTGEVRAATAGLGPDGAGVDVVVDPVGGERFLDNVRLLRPEGRVVVVGFAGGDIPTVKVNRLLLGNSTVMGAAWREFLIADPAFLADTADALAALIGKGLLRPLVGARYPLADGAAALTDLAERRVAGKVVLTVR